MDDIDKRVIPVSVWRGREDGDAPDPICTIEAMFYYPVTDTYNIVLSDENIETMYKLFKKRRQQKKNVAAPKEVIEVGGYDL